MNHSEQINEIATALAKAQSSMENPSKDAKGYGYNYATLDGCMQILKKCLPPNQLSLSQLVTEKEGKLGVETVLMHSSGQWIKSFIPLDLSGNQKMSSMQRLGSAITYARRYSLSIVGLTPEEDDDNQSQVPQQQQRPQQQQQRPNQYQQQQQRQQQRPQQQQTIANIGPNEIPF